MSNFLATLSPPVHRMAPGESLNRDSFKKTITVLGIKIPASHTTELKNDAALKGCLLDLPKIKSVVPVENDNLSRLLLLQITPGSDIPSSLQRLLEQRHLDLVPHSFEVDYNYWTADELLQSTLPESLCSETPTAFTVTGHLGHMNLREEYLPYKHLIGQVILDKNKHLRTVVNKLDNIDTQFRFFKMEVLAGEEDFIVQANESDCKFKFDFSKVYWNSRLHTEHQRLVSLFKPGEVIADVFAGVGPFAIPAARKGCLVFANDLNPSSTDYLQQNCDINKVTDYVRVTTKDGREFIHDVVVEAILRPFVNVKPIKSAKERAKEARNGKPKDEGFNVDSPKRAIQHFVMNLPATALEFLDAFKTCFKQTEIADSVRDFYNSNDMPMVHCHCFTKELDREKAESDIIQRAELYLGHTLAPETRMIHFVRAVAPNKDMYCISFRLPIAFL